MMLHNRRIPDTDIIVMYQNKFLRGKISYDGNYIVYCKFGTKELSHYISLDQRPSIFDLLDIFEDHPEIHDSNLQIFDSKITSEIPEIILEGITDPRVAQYCRTMSLTFDNSDPIVYLNRIVSVSNMTYEELSVKQGDSTYQTTRKIHINTNQYNKETFRFTIAKKILTLLRNPNTNITDKVKISIIGNPSRIKFHVIKDNLTALQSTKEIVTYSRSIIDNHDGSFRADLPSEIYNYLTDSQIMLHHVLIIKIANKLLFYKLYKTNN